MLHIVLTASAQDVPAAVFIVVWPDATFWHHHCWSQLTHGEVITSQTSCTRRCHSFRDRASQHF